MANSLKNNKSEKRKKSNSKQSGIDIPPSVSKDECVLQEPLSPTKSTINMFEELSSAYLMPKKSSGETPMSQKYDVRNDSGSDAPRGIQSESVEDKQIEKEQLDNTEKCYTKTYKTLRESNNTDLIQHVMDDPELTPSEVSAEDFKEKMKEILSIPLPEDGNDIELKEDEIDKLHEENMKILKQKLHLNSEEMNINNPSSNKETVHVAENNKFPNVKTVEIANNVTATITETIAKPISRSKSTSPVLPKCNIEEARKIYTRHKPASKERKKSIIQHTVIDLTSEILQINTNPAKIPKFPIEEKLPVVVKDEACNMYYKERELIEMAKKEKIDTGNPEINIEYLENTVKKGGESFFKRMMTIFTCGMMV